MREPDFDDAVEMAAFTAHTIGGSEAATFVVASDGTIVSWSAGAERLFRRPAWSAIGKHCHEVLAGVHVDGTPGCTADCPIRLEARLGVDPQSEDLLAGGGPEGRAPRLVRVHHVALNDALGYNAGLLHVVEPEARPHRRRV